MRNTFQMDGRSVRGGVTAPAATVSQGASLIAPVGGWDAISPISAMPEQNALELVNWFPQAGYIELRKGNVIHCDTGTGISVETVMSYQGPTSSVDRLFGASAGKIFDITSNVPTSVLTGFSSDRWEKVNFAGAGGNFLWICNESLSDAPRYYDGAAWATPAITGITSSHIVNVTSYKNRLWFVLANSTKAAYLTTVDGIQGPAAEFDVGANFKQGGNLATIGTWSSDTVNGPNEYIAFISSFGEVAVYFILDPTDSNQINFLGVSQTASPIGRRCITKIGADLGLITIDGVFPLSQVLSYDRAKLLGSSLTKNILPAMSEAATNRKNLFGWQLVSYPRSSMAILNVPVVESAEQEQFVMNATTGAWCRFTGQNANCWEIFRDRAYFGDNDGVVRMADEALADEGSDIVASMRGAFNYYGVRGRLKRWTSLRPLITTNASVNPNIALNVDFGMNAPLNDLVSEGGSNVPLWDLVDWDEFNWASEAEISAIWTTTSGVGYCASVRMVVTMQWSGANQLPSPVQINGFDVLFEMGDFI